MDCPVCKNVKLVIAERQGIEIDYCPDCRGIWLDRGELDKLIEKTAQHSDFSDASPRQSTHRSPPPQQHSEPYYRDDHKYQNEKYYKKRKGFLGDLFDFD